jgi:hypothetical protein
MRARAKLRPGQPGSDGSQGQRHLGFGDCRKTTLTPQYVGARYTSLATGCVPRGLFQQSLKHLGFTPYFSKALVKIYGDQLVCVRYRYDRERQKRYKTVELIVDEAAWEPPQAAPDPETRVYVRVAWGEASLARSITAAGGQWQRAYKLWSLPYGQVERLHLLDRLIDPDSA